MFRPRVDAQPSNSASRALPEIPAATPRPAPAELVPAPVAAPADSVSRDGGPRTRRAAEDPTPRLRAPKDGGVTLRRGGANTPMGMKLAGEAGIATVRAALGGSASTPVSNPNPPAAVGAAAAVAPRSPIPPGYTVPAGLEPSEPISTGDRVLAGAGVVLFAPIYLLFALIALIPSLIGGAIEAPKDDQADGSGTFMAGFANVYRAMMGWLNGPLYGMIWRMASPSRQFFVDRTTDPDNTIVTVRIRLTGDPSHVAQCKALEPNIEEHLAIPGYRVNVEFVDQDGPGVTTIPIDPTVWSYSEAWNPFDDDSVIDANDAYMMAHELMHKPLGLPDEYNYQSHFTNDHMGFWQKLGNFFARLVQPELPADHGQGIMDSSRSKPLARHYETILADV